MSGSLGGAKMNTHKKKDIIDFVREQGRLPTDQFGQVLSPDDMLVWFGLDECLTRAERFIIKEELAEIADAELVMDKRKQLETLQRGD